MATEATVSETMEDVLRDLHFEPVGDGSWIDYDCQLRVVRCDDGDWFVHRLNRIDGTSPAHLRRIVAAEVACAAAWRGEDAETETKE